MHPVLFRHCGRGLGHGGENGGRGLHEADPDLKVEIIAYLQSAPPVWTNDAQTIVRKMKERPIDNDLFGLVVVRTDGRGIQNMYLLKVKATAASKDKWNLVGADRPVVRPPEPLVRSKRADARWSRNPEAINGSGICWISLKRNFQCTRRVRAMRPTPLPASGSSIFRISLPGRWPR